MWRALGIPPGQRSESTMTKRISVVICVLVIAASTLISAQGGTVRFVPAQPRMVRLLEPWRPQGRGDTRIIGTVVDIRQMPVGHARVQLRDLSSGLIKQESVSGDQGEYEFKVEDPGTYVVEMVNGGQVLALSNAGALTRYQTMNTVIQLAGRWDLSRNLVTYPPSMTNFVGMSAQSSMTANTITAATIYNVTPADPGEPVSP
jgi:hypothetical protein